MRPACTTNRSHNGGQRIQNSGTAPTRPVESSFRSARPFASIRASEQCRTKASRRASNISERRLPTSSLTAGLGALSPDVASTVPQFLVVVESGSAAVAIVLETAEQVLANRVHDLKLWITPRTADPQFEWLTRQLGPDPRVRFGDYAQAMSSQPSASFHVSIPAGALLREYALGNLRTELGERAAAETSLADGSTVSITRAWAAHRARRWGRPLADVVEVADIDRRDIGIRSQGARAHRRFRPFRRLADPDSRGGRVLRQLQRVRTPAQAWRFGKWALSAIRQRATGSAGRSAGWLRD